MQMASASTDADAEHAKAWILFFILLIFNSCKVTYDNANETNCEEFHLWIEVIFSIFSLKEKDLMNIKSSIVRILYKFAS